MEWTNLQRLLRARIDVVMDGVLIVSEEFGAFVDARRHIDLLGVDRSGQLVVFELKRTGDGRHLALQALRYAALERKNGWSLAEFAGDARPDGMQRLLSYARWDADRVRDWLRAQVAERLGSTGGVLVVDDTGFEKEGRRSAGVQRQ